MEQEQLSQQEIDLMAAAMIEQINQMKSAGKIPGSLNAFGDLHDHFDANVGWGDTIDALPHAQWAAVQSKVDEILGAGGVA